jgi:ubiquinol-cytochrome c reductase cytochrome b subunit
MSAAQGPLATAREWLAERLGLDELAKVIVGGNVPGGASLWHTLGAVAAGLVVVQVVTGIFLATAYSPSVTDAWASVAYIQDQMLFGWFVRGLHSYGATGLIVVSGLHFLQVLLFGAYRRPRELNWMLGLLMLGLVVAFAISGYLLPWDQEGYWAKLVEATIIGNTPVLGGILQQLLQGGSAFGNLTLTRVYTGHILVLPLLLAGLLVLHVYLFRRHGYTAKWTLSPAEAARRAAPVWPDQAARTAVVGALALLIITIAVVARHGASLASPADANASYHARPEWYALPLYQLRMYFDGPLEIIATMIIPAIVGTLVFALPFLDGAPTSRPAERVPVLGGMALLIVGCATLATIALVKDAGDPAYQKWLAEERARSDVARRLALTGVPPEGGLAVFRNDPLNRAREIWDERCAGCHSLGGGGGDKGPDFKGYNSRAWIRGFLENPDGPLHMGPAKLEKGMRPVEGTPEELAALTEYVYAETGAKDVDAALLARGKTLLTPKDCDACHDFDGETENDGPNLKDRGTLKWVAAVIADAEHPLLFGDRNKMPKFKNKLSETEIQALARFVMAQKETK